ncbi:hypothetical protein SAICODRAFT_198941 [Saitoella complicata NRRL Y-17804]|uniref:uncharacterized protein n=1 Tax=Saitoella complicata (strain BCRC 22490 / CBS 7301 / JCM 7358 / NBRC 10748 / NRRL Y-17804) TaxID=698492 RepID=UPI0008670E64|nr:uncharacterized protein SAICODRAFT_198941 [Saitoella complicata NRRL Y-17804]ODQ55058.1 hypothetical protein SAICODRAFT_198941 [Saitoella complicata NRRL Y-17804]
MCLGETVIHTIFRRCKPSSTSESSTTMYGIIYERAATEPEMNGSLPDVATAGGQFNQTLNAWRLGLVCHLTANLATQVCILKGSQFDCSNSIQEPRLVTNRPSVLRGKNEGLNYVTSMSISEQVDSTAQLFSHIYDGWLLMPTMVVMNTSAAHPLNVTRLFITFIEGAGKTMLGYGYYGTKGVSVTNYETSLRCFVLILR